MIRLGSLLVLLGLTHAAVSAAEHDVTTPMRMCESPSLSADGSVLVVEWAGDIWAGSPHGGEMRPLTSSPAQDTDPRVSPDGRRVAFCSNRSGTRQVYVMPIEGGRPRRVTAHSESSRVRDWSTDGQTLLVSSSRDHDWVRPERLWLVDPDGEQAERLAFDAYAESGCFAGDGSILFTRLGVSWWRLGYQGARASQAWRAQLGEERYERVLPDLAAVRNPVWDAPTGSTFYLSHEGNDNGVLNLHRLGKDGVRERLTDFAEGVLASPCLATNARVIVFRHLFDLYRLNLDSAGGPEKISLVCRTDRAPERHERRLLKDATEVAYSPDGLEIALIAGGDLWVMDTVLREPRQVTHTPGPESQPEFSPDGLTLAFVSETDGQPDVWYAERADPCAFWWNNSRFDLRQVTEGAEPSRSPRFSPSGDRLAYVHGRGEIRIRDLATNQHTSIRTGWDTPDFEWSPDGRHLCYATQDDNYNRDVFIAKTEGSSPPVNLSRHPDEDRGPRWSPDGTMIAYTGVRKNDETDLFVVHLDAPPNDNRYDRFTAALELIRENRNSESGGESPTTGKIEFPINHVRDRTVRIENPGVRESRLVWSPDSERIAFSGYNGRTNDTYVVTLGDSGRPERVDDRTGRPACWLKESGVLWLSDGEPGLLDVGAGKVTDYSFKAHQLVDAPAQQGAFFLHCWRLVRDSFYDEGLHGVDWNAVRERYLPMAQDAFDRRMLADVVRMMVGELRASHQGFRVSLDRDDASWSDRTAHLGCWFRQTDGGLVVDRTAPSADQVGIEVGQRLVEVNGAPVPSTNELTEALTGPPGAPATVVLDDGSGDTLTKTVFPITYSRARDELYELWVRRCAEEVDRLSEGRLGYLHIRSMTAPELSAFEDELFSATHNRDGLVIDVRFNGGGWITDHLLSMLSHPNHAIATPRGGGDGYPQSRRVYATWTGPLIVLCNESSVSNAEIFSHAIQSTGRGRLVGQPTAGDVISTSYRRVMEYGRLRISHRGWRVASTGKPMEGAGAQPDLLVESLPGEMRRGIDRQLEVAVESLIKEIGAPATSGE